VTEAEIQIVAPAPEVRPGCVRRMAAGAWHVPAGLFFLVRHARLWPTAAVPVLLGGALAVGGLFLGVFALGAMERAVAPLPGRLPAWLALGTTLGLWMTTIALALVGSLAVTMLISAPFLDRLVRRSDGWYGDAADRDPSPTWDLSESFRGPLWFTVSLPLVFLVGLIPLLGPFLVLGLGGFMLGRQSLESALTRRGRGVAERRGWHREWRWESFGFGLAGLVTLVVLGLNALLAPAIALGAARLVDEVGAPALE
jgi:uncharacterized protein involved in cysteine biosynthesis